VRWTVYSSSSRSSRSCTAGASPISPSAARRATSRRCATRSSCSSRRRTRRPRPCSRGCAPRYVETLHLFLPQSNQYGGIHAPARPLGSLFPSLRTLHTVYRSWPQFAAAPFPALQNVTLYGAHQYDRPGDPYITPPLAEITADIEAKVPKLRSLTIS
jgi:hypothetical protein